MRHVKSLGPSNLELAPRMVQNEYVIIFTIKKIGLSIGFWLLENKHQQVR